MVKRYERRMAMALLTDVVPMGHERVGSLALSRDKTTLIRRALAGMLQTIASVVPTLESTAGRSRRWQCSSRAASSLRTSGHSARSSPTSGAWAS